MDGLENAEAVVARLARRPADPSQDLLVAALVGSSGGSDRSAALAIVLLVVGLSEPLAQVHTQVTVEDEDERWNEVYLAVVELSRVPSGPIESVVDLLSAVKRHLWRCQYRRRRCAAMSLPSLKLTAIADHLTQRGVALPIAGDLVGGSPLVASELKAAMGTPTAARFFMDAQVPHAERCDVAVRWGLTLASMAVRTSKLRMRWLAYEKLLRSA